MGTGKVVSSITGASLLLSLLFLYFLHTEIGQKTRLYVTRLRSHKPKTQPRDPIGLEQRLPGAIIVGISNCGTSAVLHYLSIHPAVSCATPERPLPEVNYFSQHYDEDLEWYRKQMPLSLPGQLTIEKSPRYFNFQEAPERIRRFNKSEKIVVVVCDPLLRFEAQTAQNVANAQQRHRKFLRLPGDQFLSRAGPDSIVRSNSSELWRGCYYNGMANLFDNFPASQIHVVDGDRLRENPYPEMLALEAFLGIARFYDKSNFFYDKSKGAFCPAAHGRVSCLADGRIRTRANMAPNLERSVRDFYKVCNKPFLDLVDRTFHWF